MGNQRSTIPQNQLNDQSHHSIAATIITASTGSTSGSRSAFAVGAHIMPAEEYKIVLPSGIRPGAILYVKIPGQDETIQFEYPLWGRPGQSVPIPIMDSRVKEFLAAVPVDATPGKKFRVKIEGRDYDVTCPNGVQPGQMVNFHVDLQRPKLEKGQWAVDFTIPDDFQPNQLIAINMNGQQVLFTHPNAQRGQRFLLKLPFQLTEQQREGSKVIYDRNKWFRCLGSDLKFHWKYNLSTSPNGNSSNEFAIEANAFIRSLNSSNAPGDVIGQQDISFIPAETYWLDSTVEGTNLDFFELTMVSKKSFKDKISWLKNQFSDLRASPKDGYVKVCVRRIPFLLDDLVNSMSQLQKEFFRMRFKYFMQEEIITDHFYSKYIQLFFHPDQKLFILSKNSKTYNINHNANQPRKIQHFRALGRLLGKSLMEGKFTPMHFTKSIYKHLLGWPITFNDLEDVDYETYESLKELLICKDVSQFGHNFTTVDNINGQTTIIDLIPNGANVVVTNENLHEYIESQIKYFLFTRISKQLSALLRGFYDIVPEALISVFDVKELELLMHDIPDINVDDLRKNTMYMGPTHQNTKRDKVLKWFWSAITSTDEETLAKFLQFVTGTAAVPENGFQGLTNSSGVAQKFTINILGAPESDENILPRAHTYLNRLDMPLYNTEEKLKSALMSAIHMESFIDINNLVSG